MKCYFRSFDVGIGDCNVIRLVKDGGEQYVIMVDCGKYTKSLEQYIEEELHNHIDLLIATHIDGDHIQGMKIMLEKHKDLTINKIWYNCYRRTGSVEPISLNEQQKAILCQIQKELPVEFDSINYREISALQGKTLAKTILENKELKKIWETSYITSDTNDFHIPEGFGKIVFLGPTPDALNEIDNKFKNTFDKYFMQQWNESIENTEELQESLIRLVDGYKEKFKTRLIAAKTEPVYDVTYIRKQAKDEKTDDSATNYSSIAFILECGEHKLAMLGDAFASTLEKSIDNKYKDQPKPLVCEAIKISHHGSNANSSRTLLNRINSYFYFIPGGKGEKYPTWATFGRIAEINKNKQVKNVVFSHPCDMTNKINNLEEKTKKELNIETIISEQEYELFEW